MCGIAGLIGKDDPERTVRNMINAQSHRGPDDEGIFVDEASKTALGSCRLAIIDLSQKAHMPMSCAGGEVQIVYNGEVYNFRDIRAELESRGHEFVSKSDTEAVLKAYMEWGEECVLRFRGMFAFAVYDNRPKRRKDGLPMLFLARDRFGIKPLYWAKTSDAFLFASELKSMLASGAVSRRIDPQAFWDYLSFGSVPIPRTMLEDVKALPPAHYMVVHGNDIRIKRYWDIVEATSQERGAPFKDMGSACEMLRELLDETVRMHSVADVPLGAFLSGGIDSSAMVAFLSRHASGPVKTFSVLFENKKNPTGELSWAKKVAENFSTDHTEIIITSGQACDDFEKIISSIDQPSADGVNVFYVSQAARRGVTVALSGIGADEIFAGYGLFNAMIKVMRLSGSGWTRAGKVADFPVVRCLPGKWQRALRCLAGGAEYSYANIRSSLTEHQKRRAVNSGVLRNRLLCPPQEAFRPYVREALEAVSQATYMEINGYLACTLLRDTDAMSMAHSLEVRVPFLDHHIAEFAFSLPPQFKINGAFRKIVLVEAMKDLLPREILERQKRGFVIPWNDTIGEGMCRKAAGVFCDPAASRIFSAKYIKSVLSDFREKRNLASHWPAAVLLGWMRQKECFI